MSIKHGLIQNVKLYDLSFDKKKSLLSALTCGLQPLFEIKMKIIVVFCVKKRDAEPMRDQK